MSRYNGKIPVVFIHRGDGETYLECVIKQAKSFDNPVVLIGDKSNKKFSSIAEHQLISGFSYYSKKFEDVYVPLSTHGDYETFCFQRWFVLYEWMKRKNVDKCFYLDSDVLFYANTNEEAEKYKYFDFTLAHRCCGHASYFTYNGLRTFCKFLFETYVERGFDYDKIASHWELHKKYNRTGGVCDMTLFEYFARYKNPGGVAETMHIINDSTYDHCINQADYNYEMVNGLKNIQFKDGIPYCRQLQYDKLIRFVALHCQGGCKGLIPKYYEIGLNTRNK